MTTRDIINEGKNYIKYNDLKGLESIYYHIAASTNDYLINGVYVFRNLYIYACQYGTRETLIWFIELFYEVFSDIERIALRQLFIYGKYTMRRNRCISVGWYNDSIISLVKIA